MLRSFTKIRVPRATRSFAISPLCLGDTKHKPPILPGTLLNCPKCTKLLPTPIPVCPNCAYISRMNNTIPYHTLFQLPLEPNPFVVDTFKLKQKYLEAQKLCHPDAWAVHGEATQAVAHSLSHFISRAWSILRDPLPRAEYILGLNGIEIAEADQLEDFELISEIMEVREQLESATLEEIETIAEKNYEETRKVCADIEKSVGEQDWQNVKTATVRLKYLEGIKKAASQWRPDAA